MTKRKINQIRQHVTQYYFQSQGLFQSSVFGRFTTCFRICMNCNTVNLSLHLFKAAISRTPAHFLLWLVIIPLLLPCKMFYSCFHLLYIYVVVWLTAESMKEAKMYKFNKRLKVANCILINNENKIIKGTKFGSQNQNV